MRDLCIILLLLTRSAACHSNSNGITHPEVPSVFKILLGSDTVGNKYYIHAV